MKLKIAIFLFVLSLAFPGFSQDKPFRFGFKAAPNISWIAPDSKDYESDGIKMGFSWGLLAEFTLTENYFVKTGFSMDYLNGKLQLPYTKEEVPVTLNRTYHLRYLEIPLSLKMRTNKFGKTAYFGEIGIWNSL